MINCLLDLNRTDRAQKNKVIHKIRTAQGTKTAKNITARQVLRVNVIKSRLDRYPMNEIAEAYHISLRTVHKYIKFVGSNPTKKIFRFKGKLMMRAYLTKLWIRYIIRYNITDLEMVIDNIEEKVKPP